MECAQVTHEKQQALQNRVTNNITLWKQEVRSWNLEASTSWNPQGLSRPVMKLLYQKHWRPVLWFIGKVNYEETSASITAQKTNLDLREYVTPLHGNDNDSDDTDDS